MDIIFRKVWLRIMRREARLWIESAKLDLEDAKKFIELERWFRAAFFSQQCVEKILKALYYIVRKEPPPHIHTITELYLGIREAGYKFPDRIEKELPILNKYYTITRYPDAANALPSEAVDEVEARRAVELAEEVYDYVKNEV